MKTIPTLLKAVIGVVGMTVFACFSGARADGNADHAAFLEVHNTARASVNVANLTWSDSLAAGAQTWANQLAAQDTLKHSPQPRPEGENIFSGSDGYTAVDAAKDWLSEKDSYSGGAITIRVSSVSPEDGTGHVRVSSVSPEDGTEPVPPGSGRRSARPTNKNRFCPR